ncbi:MAG: anthranilate phosphoribosyltransferase [Gemmatimonadota bacterium]|nr:anthranilate phosphoribosyltransferase [Gemmatimonadota bacterium]
MTDTSSSTPLHDVILALAHERALTQDAVTAAFDVVMRGDATPVQISALLTGLRVRGESAEVVAGAASALRRAMVRFEIPEHDDVVDTCGTGGGAVGTFNISTAAALVAAGAGVRIAKHGNRSFTSKCGSADVLEALGVDIDVDGDAMHRAFNSAGIVFMFAPRMHPAMRYVGPVRRELGVPTVMNIIGPLANPASAGRQVIGVADAGRAGIIAQALAALGTVHSLIVHGEPGMDEVSPFGPTRILEIRGDRVTEWSTDPESLGAGPARASELMGGTPDQNAQLVRACLDGTAPAGAIAAVVVNAGAAIYVAGLAGSVPDGVAMARSAIGSGAAVTVLERLRAALPRS